MHAQKLHVLKKNCNLCKEHRGVHIMHNTMESCCYKKYGTTTWGTFGQAQRKPDKDRNSKKSYMQVLTRMENLRSLSRKLRRRAGNVAITRQVTVTLTLPEALGTVVLGKIRVIVRNLKLKR